VPRVRVRSAHARMPRACGAQRYGARGVRQQRVRSGVQQRRGVRARCARVKQNAYTQPRICPAGQRSRVVVWCVLGEGARGRCRRCR